MHGPDTRVRAALLTGLLVLATVAAGCSALSGANDELPSGDEVADTLDSLEAVEATMVSEMNVSGEQTTSRMSILTRPRTGEFRAEVLREDGQPGTLIVSNGTTMYMYNRTADRVQVVDVSGLDGLRNGSMASIAEIFEHLDGESTAVDTPASISSLPVVPAGAGGGASVSSLPLYGNVTYDYEGTGTVAGREAYVVEVVPQGEDPILRNVTTWLDADWYYPLKQTGQVTVGGANGSVSMAYRNVTFNPDVPAGAFSFDPPANATVEDSSDRQFESVESRKALASATNRSLPDPELHPGYAFEKGSRIANPEGEQVSLRYAAGDRSLSITVQPPGDGADSSTGESITVDGRDATVTTLGERRIVELSCGDRTYNVIGNESRDVLVDVTASLSCG